MFTGFLLFIGSYLSLRSDNYI